MKKTLFISLIILTSCGSLKQSKSISRIEKQIFSIDKSTKLKTNTFDLSEHFGNEDGYFNVSKLKTELKKITIHSQIYNNRKVTTVYLEKELIIFIRQSQVLTTKAELTNGTIETFNDKYQTDFYILDWENQNYRKIIPNGFNEIMDEYKYKKEKIEKIIEISNKLILQ